MTGFPQLRADTGNTRLTMNDTRKNLHKHFKQIADLHLRDLFKENPDRFQHFSLEAADLFLDYSKNRITTDTLHQLVRLAESEKVEDKIQAMFAGKPINTTENRPVLHIALRNRSNRPIMVNGIDIMPTVNATLDKIRAFTKKCAPATGADLLTNPSLILSTLVLAART